MPEIKTSPLLNDVENVAKLAGVVGSFAAMDNHFVASNLALAGIAALEASHDFDSLCHQKTFMGAVKYSSGLLADVAMGAGAVGLAASDYVPAKYTAPFLVGGLLARFELGFHGAK